MKSIDLVTSATGSVQLLSDVVSHITENHTLSKLSFYSGIATDALSLASEYTSSKSKRKKSFYKDVALTASHYLPVLTSFFPLTITSSLLSLGLTTGVSVYQQQQRLNQVHTHADILRVFPSLLSSITTFSRQSGLLVQSLTQEGSFGHTYYGRLDSHPSLTKYHRFVKKINPKYGRVPLGINNEDTSALGKTVFLRGKDPFVTINMELLSQREKRINPLLRVHKKTSYLDELILKTVVHEYGGHVEDVLLNKRFPTPDQSHDDFFKAYQEHAWLRAHGLSMVTERQRQVLRITDDLLPETRKRERIDLDQVFLRELNQQNQQWEEDIEQPFFDVQNPLFKSSLLQRKPPLRRTSRWQEIEMV